VTKKTVTKMRLALHAIAKMKNVAARTRLNYSQKRVSKT
jgi:hypothetical protein